MRSFGSIVLSLLLANAAFAAEDLLEYRHATIRRVMCDAHGGQVSFTTNDGKQLHYTVRHSAFQAKYYRMNPAKFCLSLKKMSSEQGAVNLQTAFVPTKTDELGEEIVKAMSDGLGVSLTDTESEAYVEPIVCGNVNRSLNVCLLSNEEDNYYLQVKPFLGEKKTYRAVVTSKLRAIDHLDLVVRSKISNTEFVDLSLSIPDQFSKDTVVLGQFRKNGKQDDPPFKMRRPETSSQSPGSFDN